MATTFGELVRELRERSNRSQAELAEDAGLQLDLIQRLEGYGDASPVAWETPALAKALRVNSDYLTLAAGRVPTQGTHSAGR